MVPVAFGLTRILSGLLRPCPTRRLAGVSSRLVIAGELHCAMCDGVTSILSLYFCFTHTASVCRSQTPRFTSQHARTFCEPPPTSLWRANSTGRNTYDESMVDTQKVLKQLREKVDREIQGAEADIESIRKALTIPEKRPRLRRKRRTK